MDQRDNSNTPDDGGEDKVEAQDIVPRNPIRAPVWKPRAPDHFDGKLTSDQINYALDQISLGEGPDIVAKRLKVTIQAFTHRERKDPEFAKAYQNALSDRAEVLLRQSFDNLVNNEDHRKAWDAAAWTAERVAKRYAAKSLIQADNITIQFNRGVDDDWSYE